jgi:hypothetical protein
MGNGKVTSHSRSHSDRAISRLASATSNAASARSETARIAPRSTPGAKATPGRGAIGMTTSRLRCPGIAALCTIREPSVCSMLTMDWRARLVKLPSIAKVTSAVSSACAGEVRVVAFFSEWRARSRAKEAPNRLSCRRKRNRVSRNAARHTETCVLTRPRFARRHRE